MTNRHQQNESSVTPETPVPSATGFVKKRASLLVDSLEPRILLSATMIDAESIDKSAIPDIHAVELSPAEVTVEGYVFEGTDKEDWLKASDGDDVILGGGGDDHLYGLGGNDRFVYREGDGADIVLGGEGTDTIDATDAKTLQLTELTAEHSVETIFGNEGGLQIEGTANNDVLDFQNTTLKNVSGIDAGQGNDQVTGSSDNDVIAAGAGDDTLSGGDGDGDVLVLSGNRSEYKVVEQKDGSIEIYDSRGADGNDLVREFERFSFADETVDREGLFRDPSDTLMISDTSVREDVSADTVVAKLYTANDEKSGPHSFTLVDETGNETKDANFLIQDNALIVRYGHSLDFESSDSEVLNIRVTNSSGASFIQNVKLTIKDANDAPLGVQMSEHTVSEDAKSGTVVGTLTAIDADQNDSHTFTLVNSEGKEVDDPRFVIQDNSLIVRADGVLDYEGHSIETVYVRVEDSAGAIYTEQLTIGVSNVVEQSSEYEEDGPPVIIVIDDSVEILPETFTTADWHVTDDFAQAVSTTITTESYSTVDSVWSETSFYTEYGAEYETTWVTETTTWYETTYTTTTETVWIDHHILYYVEVTDWTYDPESGDYAITNSYSFSTDSFNTEAITTTWTTSSTAYLYSSTNTWSYTTYYGPSDIQLSDEAVAEDAMGGTVVGKLFTSDADKGDSHSYTLVDAKGNEVKNSNFEIRDNAIVVRDGHSLDYEASASETLYVKATDTEGASFIRAVTLNVKDANDAPFAVSLSETTISEDAAAGTVVGKLSTSDADKGDSHSYTLVDARGNEVKNSNFEIRDNAIVVSDGHSLNYEASTSETLFVKATDRAGASVIQAVTLNVKDANDAPFSVSLSDTTISEDATAGTVVGKLSTSDADKGDSHSSTLVDARGNEVKNTNFAIRDNAIVVKDGHSLNYEASTSETLFVKATDRAGASVIQAVTLNVKDANDAPFAVSLSETAISEDATAGTVVGKLSTSDADRGDSHSYTLVDAKGNEVKNSNFEIRDNAIVVRDGHSLNYEASTSETLYVKATDRAGASVIQAVTLNVKDANDAPVAVFETITTSEDQPISVQFRSFDEDAEVRTVEYRIESLPSHGQLLLNGSPVEVGGIVSSVDQSEGRLRFFPDRNWHGEESITFRASDGQQWSDASAEIRINVAPLADAASLVVEPATGVAGATISLKIAAGLPDIDSGEDLMIYISGVPEGVTLNAGERQPDGTWMLLPADLNSLTMTLSPLPPAQFSLTVTVVTAETNGSTATTTAELEVNILPGNERSDDPESEPEAAIPFSAVPDPRREPATAPTALPYAELPPARFVSHDASPPASDHFGVTPLGYTFLLPITETPDWSNTIFGEVRPMTFSDDLESSADPAVVQHTLAPAETTAEQQAGRNESAATTNPLLWFWSAARALGGVRDERKGR